jgi:peptide deformylase
MIYPIIPYGDPVLRKVASTIEVGSVDLIKLSEDMFETMYAASGVGLAAPQVGLGIRLFVVDGRPMNEGEKDEDVDESLIGGFIVRMGDHQIDASVSNQLNRLKQELVK